MKKLSIVIPYHNESEDIIFPLLSSIDFQVDINFDDIEVVISNNCDVPRDLTSLFTSLPNLNSVVKYIESPVKSGMGQNRQNGLVHAIGEYVTFCDCDDSFDGPLSIKTILDGIQSNKSLYKFLFRKEAPKNAFGELTLSEYAISDYILHGSVFKKSFLTELGIQFCPYIFAFEDCYFNFVVEHLTIYEHVLKPIYMWKHNSKSMSRKVEEGFTTYIRKWRVDSLLWPYYGYITLKEIAPFKIDEMMLPALNAITAVLDSCGMDTKDPLVISIVTEIVNDSKITEEFIRRTIKFDDASYSENLISWIDSLRGGSSDDFCTKYNIRRVLPYNYGDNI